MAQAIADCNVELFKTFIDTQYNAPSVVDFNNETLEAVFLSSYTPADAHVTGSSSYNVANIITRQDLTGVTSFRTLDSEVVIADNLVFKAGVSPFVTNTSIVVIQRKSDEKLIAFVNVSLDNATDAQYLTWNPSRILIDYDIPCGLADDGRVAGLVTTGVTTTAVPLPEQTKEIEDYLIALEGSSASRMQDNLIWQFKGLDNITSLLDLPSLELDKVLADVQSIQGITDITVATGDPLDVIGSWVGLLRTANETDEEYRYNIYIQILKNTSTGTLPRVIDIVDKSIRRFNLPDTLTVEDSYPASVTLGYTSLELLEKYKLEEVDELLPAGIGVDYAYLDTDNCFSMELGNGLGFDSVKITVAGAGNYNMLELDSEQYLFFTPPAQSQGTINFKFSTTSDGTLLHQDDLRLYVDSGVLKLDYLTSTYSMITVNDNTVRDIAITYGSSNIKVYLDAVPQLNQTVPLSPLVGTLFLGRDKSQADDLPMHIALFRLWDFPLGQASITANYNGGDALAFTSLNCLERGIVSAVELLKDFPSVEGVEGEGGELTSTVTTVTSNSRLVAFSLDGSDCQDMGFTSVDYELTDVISGQFVDVEDV